MAAVDLSTEELCALEKSRVRKIILESEEPLRIDKLSDQYKEKHKVDLEFWKEEFSRLEAFLRYGCGATINGDIVSLSPVEPHASSKPGSSGSSQAQLQYISKPQFSPFYGFGSDKGVSYNVWRYEVKSATTDGFHANEVISEQIRRSLQGEAKTKLLGLDSGTTPEAILAKLDQFYSDLDATTGDEILSEAYRMKQKDNEEVAEYASRLDNQVRKAKTHGTELLPDEQAVDKQLRLLFWEGLKEPVKDKARHKKDSCKTFADLISAARYGEKELSSAQASKRLARVNQVTKSTEDQPDSDPANLPQPFVNQRSPWQLPTCYRCGQVGHVRRGCRNPPQFQPSMPAPGNGQTPSAWGGRR